LEIAGVDPQKIGLLMVKAFCPYYWAIKNHHMTLYTSIRGKIYSEYGSIIGNIFGDI